jgi:glutathione S-transferase
MSSCAQKVRFVLAEKGLEWDGEELDLRAGDQHTEAFLKINPKGLVPALSDGGQIVTESNIICEYLEDRYPDTALLPDDAMSRARARLWTKKLDDGIHMEVIAISFGIAFRHQFSALGLSKDEIDEMMEKIPDPYTRDVQKQVVHDGIDSPRYEQAIIAFDKLFDEMDVALAQTQWLAGNSLTLADIAYVPYVARMDHLQLLDLWNDKKHLMDWYDRIQKTDGFIAGMQNWYVPKYLEMMAKTGNDARARTKSILEGQTRN